MIQPCYPMRKRHELRFRTLTVLSTTLVSTCFQRITLGGPQLEGFSSSGYDDHIKIFFPKEPDSFVAPVVGDDSIVWHGAERPAARDYTPIYDAKRRALELDFYLHDGGVASRWAQRVQPGEPAFIGGPRGSLVVPVDYPWQLYLCDESGMPALGQRLRALRTAGYRGQLHLFVMGNKALCRDYLSCFPEFNIHYFEFCQEPELTGQLAQLLPLPDDVTPWMWMVGEGEFIKRIGAPFNQENIDSRLIRQIAYWHAK